MKQSRSGHESRSRGSREAVGKESGEAVRGGQKKGELHNISSEEPVSRKDFDELSGSTVLTASTTLSIMSPSNDTMSLSNGRVVAKVAKNCQIRKDISRTKTSTSSVESP